MIRIMIKMIIFGAGFVKAMSVSDQGIIIILIIKSKPSTRQDRQKYEFKNLCGMRKKIYDQNHIEQHLCHS